MSIVRRFRLLRALLLGSALVAAVLAPGSAVADQGGRRAVEVIVPEVGNLQLLAFWVALGGGYFAREGLDVHVMSPPSPGLAGSLFRRGVAPVALLAGPDYERLIADRVPLLIAANLLQNDPLELVMRREVAERFHLAGTPVRRRLDALRGTAIGVSVQDSARLYELYRSEGLDANISQIVVRKPEELVGAFGAREVDLIYVPTPYAEKALVDKDGVVYVDGAAGEIPSFAERLVQALVVTKAFADARPADVQGLVRAIARAEHLVHFEPKAATAAVLRAVPQEDQKHAARLVALYQHAVPATPHVEAALIKREAPFYPAGGDALDLSGVDLASFVLTGGAEAEGAKGAGGSSGYSSHGGSGLLLWALALVLAIGITAAVADQRDGDEGREDKHGASGGAV